MTVTEAFSSSPTVGDAYTSRPTVGSNSGLPPVLGSLLLVLRASSINRDTFTAGSTWANEGTAGSTLNATPDGTPVLATSPENGFVTADGSSGTQGASSPYYYVPHSALLDPGTGSFFAFSRTLWTISSPGGNENIITKVTSDPVIGAGGSGWTIFDSGNLPGVTAAVANAGSSFPFNPAVAISDGGHLTPGEHMVGIGLDRPTDTLSIWVDGVQTGEGDASAVTTVGAVHELIFGRGSLQTVRAAGYANRMLSSTEVADLYDELGAT